MANGVIIYVNNSLKDYRCKAHFESKADLIDTMPKRIRICCLITLLMFPHTLWSLTEMKNPLTADIQFYLKHLGYRVGSKLDLRDLLLKEQ